MDAGLITPAPFRVPNWTWNTGLRVSPEDCNLVFRTSNGQVTMAPMVPLHLRTSRHIQNKIRNKIYFTKMCANQTIFNQM